MCRKRDLLKFWKQSRNEAVDIDKMQYGFMSGRVSDAVSALRRLSEKVRAKNEKLFFVFADLEKVFDRVSREVNCFALR